MDLRIGIIQAPRELDIELAEGESQDAVHGRIDKALADSDGVLWLTDKRGRQVAVPVARIAYVEIGADDARRVGFGAS
ncbi:MAG TPA: DUF3107 domain-containing protein [Acidimicrobiales bacterium]|nr:DUF3107 domain-containing protein [Acidimicrobiales bacterium]